MQLPAFDRTVSLASGLLTLTNQESGRTSSFDLNEGQRIVLGALIEHPQVAVCKGRQIGISSVVCLVDLLHAVLNPGQAVCIITDVDDNSKGLLAMCRAWGAELGVQFSTANESKLVLKGNGSSIVAKTAISHAASGDSRVGRSKTFGRLHVSELSYYANDVAVFSSLTSSLLSGARIVVESTAAGGDTLFKRIFKSTDPEWHRVFLGHALHRNYRHAPEYLSDEEWAAAQLEGHTDRASAAWWYRQLRTKKDNNVHVMKREHPVKPEDAFSAALGRYILKHTPTSPNRTDRQWSYFAAPDPTDPSIVSVDVASGSGGDFSAIVVIGQRTGSLLAHWVSNTTAIPAMLVQLKRACSEWSAVQCLVEKTGIGEGPLAEMKLTSWAVDGPTPTKGEKPLRMDMVRHAIETGEVLASPELVEEIESSIVKASGEYVGRDDLLNAIGHALVWRKHNPYVAPPKRYDPAVYVVPQPARVSQF